MSKNIYIAACDKNGGIYHFTQNDDGSLTEKNFYPLDRPLYMTVEKNKMYIILREPFDDDTNSGVMSFEIEKDGSLIRPVECESTEGKCACHLTVKDGNIYCVNYISGSVIKVGEKLVMNIGNGPNKPRQDKTHMHFVNFSPDEKYLLVTDLGLDTIFTYDKNLNEISRAKVPDGHGVRHLAYSGDGKYIFSANELASTVSVFSYNDGKLELIDTLSGIPSDFTNKTTMAAIRVHDGFIYASNRGHDSISKFSFDGTKLHLEDVISVGGSGPRDFDFIGDYVYSTNEQTNNVTVLKNENGKLTLLPFTYNMPDPLCVITI